MDFVEIASFNKSSLSAYVYPMNLRQIYKYESENQLYCNLQKTTFVIILLTLYNIRTIHVFVPSQVIMLIFINSFNLFEHKGWL